MDDQKTVDPLRVHSSSSSESSSDASLKWSAQSSLRDNARSWLTRRVWTHRDS